jgi:tight adherence protein C
MNTYLLLGVIMLPLAAGVAFWSVKADSSGKITAEDLAGARPTDLREALLAQSAKERAVKPALDKIYKSLRKITPVGWVDTIEQRLMLADSRTRVEFILLQKVVFCVLFFVFFQLKFNITFGGKLIGYALVIGKPLLGFFLPDIILKNKADKRQGDILKSLPDVLDQITVGVEAGLGFDAAMARTAKSSEGPLAQELMRQFVGAILQAEQYGIPMAQVLRVQAAEQRRRRRQRAEEKAMKLPVKVLFPLVLCILPTLFIVLIGPAVINIANNV